MTCDEIKILLMEFLYNESEPESEKLLRAHLQSCAACRNEYETLSRTSLTLKAWENEDPPLHLVFVRENKSWLAALKEKIYPANAPLWGKLAWASGLLVVGMLFISALLNMEISYNAGKFTYRANLLPRQSPVAAVDSQLVMQMQQQNRDLFRQWLVDSQEQQRDELNRTLAQFAAEINRQRRSDLLLVGRGLEQVQEHTTTRIERTDEMLNRFLRSVNFQPQQ